MAQETLIRVKCDRCPRIVREVPSSEMEGAEKGAPLLLLDATMLGAGLGRITYEDLCDRCKKRVADLVRMITKEDPEEKKGGDGDEKGDASKDAPGKSDETKGDKTKKK